MLAEKMSFWYDSKNRHVCSLLSFNQSCKEWIILPYMKPISVTISPHIGLMKSKDSLIWYNIWTYVPKFSRCCHSKIFVRNQKRIFFFFKNTYFKNYKFFTGDHYHHYNPWNGEFPLLSLTGVLNNLHGLTFVEKFFIAVLFCIIGTPINSTRNTKVSLK